MVDYKLHMELVSAPFIYVNLKDGRGGVKMVAWEDAELASPHN